MGNAYEEAPERMLRLAATETVLAGSGESMSAASLTAGLVFRQRVAAVLEEAGIPQADRGWDDEDNVPTCIRSGYSLTDPEKQSSKVADIAILGRTGVPDEVRQGERDALTQQTRAALAAAGIEVRVNEYGHLKAVNR